MEIRNATLVKASSAWKTSKAGENYKTGKLAFQINNWDIALEQELGFYGANGHLVTYVFDGVELKSVPVSVSSTIKRPEPDADPVRITTISTSFKDDRGEVDQLGEVSLNTLGTLEIRYSQLPLKMPLGSGEEVDTETGEIEATV